MSLRKSPARTPALLAANRANARKSTGPCTLQGKVRVALGALRHGVHASDFLSALGKSRFAWEEYKQLYLALSEHKPGDQIKVTVRRGDERLEFTVALAPL